MSQIEVAVQTWELSGRHKYFIGHPSSDCTTGSGHTRDIAFIRPISLSSWVKLVDLAMMGSWDEEAIVRLESISRGAWWELPITDS